MTTRQGEPDAWLDPGFVRRWAAEDALGELLVLPRRVAAALSVIDGGPVSRVIDIGAGPGAFLKVMLEAHPRAEGVWIDVSSEMEQIARDRLAPLGDRVRFILGDMTALDDLDPGGPVNVIVSSRASHHLSPAELGRFYRTTLRWLSPGGWLFNLDHIRPTAAWDARYRTARRMLVDGQRRTTDHHHSRPSPTLEEHLAAARSADAVDVEVAWKAFYTILLAMRAPAH